MKSLSAYDLIEEKDLPEIGGKGYVLSHKKTKARVCVIENEEDNKVFNIGFRTPPCDDKGTPHIMEHSVLCGSKNFPAKDPFVELCKGSLNTFLNAMTFPDKTLYPVASQNDQDFHNLMHVYLDAVFHPNIYDREEIMNQEGWHYEVDDEGNLIYNGVVYNEMKGVYSSADDLLARAIEKSLYPNTAYAFESGGDPEYITDLTREEFLNFHKKYYHPSNSYIYLYGNGDFAKELQFIDENYLSNYDYLEVESELQLEPGFTSIVEETKYYSLAENEDEVDNTYISYNVVTGLSNEKTKNMALDIIDYLLTDAPGAPLKEALIEAGICKDVSSGFSSELRQTNFSIIIRNSNKSDKSKFISITEEVLGKIVKDGFDKRSLNAAINRFIFRHKEANFNRYPKGLIYSFNALETWLHDDNAALDNFSYDEVFEELREGVDKGYFENLIKECILENNHKSIVIMEPVKGLGEVIDANEREKLAEIRSKMSDEEFEAVKANAEHLKIYQSEPTPDEDLETIPLLQIEDLSKDPKKIFNKECEIDLVKIVQHDIFTNGISYLTYYFDCSDIDVEKYPYIALLTDLFKYMDTENFSYSELATDINYYSGGIGFSNSVFTVPVGDNRYEPKLYFHAGVKALDENLEKSCEILNEILLLTKLDNKKRLRELIAETRVNLKDSLTSSGHVTARDRALSYISDVGVVNDMIQGVAYYEFLSDIDDNFDAKSDEFITNLVNTLGEVLCRNNMVVSYTSKNDPEVALANIIPEISKKLSTRLKFDNPSLPVPKKRNEGFKTASKVNYVATAGNFVQKGLKYTGVLDVLNMCFSYDYLWINVRVKGGAYGSMCSFSRSGNGLFTSYRDPNMTETYDIYKNAVNYVGDFDASDRDMIKYIIGAIGKLDMPLTPSAHGSYSMVSYIMGVDEEMLRKERAEILACTVEDIRAVKPYIEAILSSDTICAIGNDTKIEENKAIFDEIRAVF